MQFKISFGINDVIDFLVVGIIFKLVIVQEISKFLSYLLNKLLNLLFTGIKLLFLMTEKDVAVLLHRFFKAQREGHIAPSVEACGDGHCKEISR